MLPGTGYWMLPETGCCRVPATRHRVTSFPVTGPRIQSDGDTSYPVRSTRVTPFRLPFLNPVQRRYPVSGTWYPVDYRDPVNNEFLTPDSNSYSHGGTIHRQRHQPRHFSIADRGRASVRRTTLCSEADGGTAEGSCSGSSAGCFRHNGFARRFIPWLKQSS